MPQLYGQNHARTPISAIVKANPTRLRFGALDTPMPAPYANSVGMIVEVNRTGWSSLDGKWFKVAAWQDGGASTFPDLTLEGCDTTGEQGAQPPNAGDIGIPQIPANWGRP